MRAEKWEHGPCTPFAQAGNSKPFSDADLVCNYSVHMALRGWHWGVGQCGTTVVSLPLLPRGLHSRDV